jgi:membrane-bound lytic murein transglycosylase A
MYSAEPTGLRTATRAWRAAALLASALLIACAGAPPTVLGSGAVSRRSELPHDPIADFAPSVPTLLRSNSRWTPVSWSDLPGFEEDSLHEAWNAWIKSCERPGPQFAPLCPDIRLLSLGTAQEQRAWMRSRLQPYRIDPLGSEAQGLLTAYYEPMLEASRVAREGFNVPLYAAPAGAKSGKPGFSRQEMDTLPQARAALGGRELLWLADPVDAMILQIQGSGRLHVTERDGQQRWVRLSYAGSNNHPYQSLGRWLLERNALQDASWPGIKAWIAQNPQRLQELLWSNPRVVFFREDTLSEFDAAFGPRGAQGVALTPQRSIAVDPGSIPYGTPVWLVSNGPATKLQRLVMAQDTGSAIVGALRADYFAGWGAQAGELAGRLKQSLQLWVLWPK